MNRSKVEGMMGGGSGFSRKLRIKLDSLRLLRGGAGASL